MNKIVLIKDSFKITNLFEKIFIDNLSNLQKEELYKFKYKYSIKQIIHLLYINTSTRRRMDKNFVLAVEKYNKNIFVLLYNLIAKKQNKNKIFIKILNDNTKYIEIVNIDNIEECLECENNSNNLFSSIDWWKKQIPLFCELIETKDEKQSFLNEFNIGNPNGKKHQAIKQKRKKI